VNVLGWYSCGEARDIAFRNCGCDSMTISSPSKQ
jgi:hypothetical protein